MENNKNEEDFSITEKFLMIFFWFRAVLIGDWNLRKDGYTLKHRNRLICIAIGILFYSIIVLYANV
ncbi:MAG: hypothetical protein WCK02_07405 [Bacteroidota bacterium]